jgi:hypothetical protein
LKLARQSKGLAMQFLALLDIYKKRCEICAIIGSFFNTRPSFKKASLEIGSLTNTSQNIIY